MKVKFLPMNVEHDINPGESVLELAKRHGVFVKSLCGGMPSCAECRVKIVEGEHNILGPSFKEKALIGSAYFIDHSRLSCQVKCMGDITVDLTEQIEKQNAQPVSKRPRAPIKRPPRVSAAVRAAAATDENKALPNSPQDPRKPIGSASTPAKKPDVSKSGDED